MRPSLALVLAGAVTAGAFATTNTNILDDAVTVIPDRIKGGDWYKQQQQQQQLAAASSTPRARHWHARVDNFNASDERTFRQRYFVDDQYFDEATGCVGIRTPSPSPFFSSSISKSRRHSLVFLLIGGEGTLTGPPKGFMGELAKSYGALLVALEHRFYGESLPNGYVT
jgi:hypothetical protein